MQRALRVLAFGSALLAAGAGVSWADQPESSPPRRCSTPAANHNKHCQTGATYGTRDDDDGPAPTSAHVHEHAPWWNDDDCDTCEVVDRADVGSKKLALALLQYAEGHNVDPTIDNALGAVADLLDD